MCRKASHDSEELVKRQTRFRLLCLEIKMMIGTAQHTIGELFDYSENHRISEENWASFMADALVNGVPSIA